MFESAGDYLSDLSGRVQADFLPNFINLIRSLFQYFTDLFKYITGEKDTVPEVDPVGE